MKKFWKGLMLLVVGGLLGGAGGFAVGIFVYPFLFLADITATETVANREQKQVVATAAFRHADPSDPFHFGKGRATVFADLVHLEPDFEVGPGPRYHLYLTRNAPVNRSADFDKATSVDLGRINAFKGSQNYPVPPGLDLSEFKSLVVWCEAFGVLVSPAELQWASATNPPQ